MFARARARVCVYDVFVSPFSLLFAVGLLDFTMGKEESCAHGGLLWGTASIVELRAARSAIRLVIEYFWLTQIGPRLLHLLASTCSGTSGPSDYTQVPTQHSHTHTQPQTSKRAGQYGSCDAARPELLPAGGTAAAPPPARRRWGWADTATTAPQRPLPEGGWPQGPVYWHRLLNKKKDKTKPKSPRFASVAGPGDAQLRAERDDGLLVRDTVLRLDRDVPGVRVYAQLVRHLRWVRDDELYVRVFGRPARHLPAGQHYLDHTELRPAGALGARRE